MLDSWYDRSGCGWFHYVGLLRIPVASQECCWLRRRLRVSKSAVVLVLLKSCANEADQSSIFLSLGELGPGDNIGLLAAKTSATAVRGQYYAIAAAVGKIGAFVGTYVFPLLMANPNPIRAGQDPFFVASALCIFASIIVFFGLPHIGQVSELSNPSAGFRYEVPTLTNTLFRTLLPRRTRSFVYTWKRMATTLLRWVRKSKRI